ncbi:hypothetical protein [Endozoicomonas sp. Mp262]|uniref:hypothetical protein n=1 Tax=Endozoicomonas sp. Mp262 TaxID=2919499 RepID=UPI0021DB363A
MELFDIFTDLMGTLKTQRRKINGHFPNMVVTNETLDNLYNRLRSTINNVEQYLLTSVTFDFSDAPEKCSVGIGPFLAEVNGIESVEQMMDLSKADTEVQKSGLKPSVIRDVEVIRNLTELLDYYGIKEEVPDKMQCFALLAYDHLRTALDCLKIKHETLPSDSEQIEYAPLMYFLFPEDEQSRNIILASHHGFKAIDALDRAYVLPFIDNGFEQMKAVWIREIESKKNRARVRIRHKPSYARQEIIIEVYKNGDYKDEYNKPNNKSHTARKILKRVNERCQQENLPQLKDSSSGGIKTIIKCIDEHMKKEAMH